MREIALLTYLLIITFITICGEFSFVNENIWSRKLKHKRSNPILFIFILLLFFLLTIASYSAGQHCATGGGSRP
ncbi:Hypothetical protein ETEE_0851 [Edwardsiella anguillarum ET080813]|uniref:Uncharacterized protein n=1 Tax=Edwardsiella anguillarum ET080813 TaxID=667120 RepID=A0A076LGU4_9GAMM|nr:Hypothetical protein ETEE_0851 [Edwardsiella anguillarum ET080813]